MNHIPQGSFNAEKCIRYLRIIGVEIDEATEASWLDAQKAHRLLERMKRTKKTHGDWWCENEHQFYDGDRAVFPKQKKGLPEPRCPICGARFKTWAARGRETHDGTVIDYRPKEERWKALDHKPSPIGTEGPPDLLSL